jgi:hypothetical protein
MCSPEIFGDFSCSTVLCNKYHSPTEHFRTTSTGASPFSSTLAKLDAKFGAKAYK